MAKFAHKTTILRFSAVFLLFIAITPVFGRGNQEADLTKADELINIKEYDEATALLTDYIRRYPDRFELANQRLLRIFQIRNEFNKNADELIYLLINDPDNSERVFALTSKLRTLENDNSPLMLNFVNKAHEIAQFNVLRSQLRAILVRGREQIDRGDNEGALQTYAGGMTFMRDEFFAAGFGTQIERDAQQETLRLNTLMSSFRSDISQLRTISADLERAINTGQTARITELTARLMPVIDDYIKRKQELFSTINNIDRILDNLRRADPGMGDRNYLAFVSRVVHGRTEETIQEGMLGVYDAVWRSSVGAVLNAITANIESTYISSLALFNAGNYSTTAQNITGNENLINLPLQFFNKHRLFQEGGNPQTVTMFNNHILQNDLQLYLKTASLTEAGNTINRASNIALRLVIDRSSVTNWQQGRITLDEALSREQQTRSTIAGMHGEFESIRRNAVQKDAEISAHNNVSYIRDAVSAIDNVSTAIIAEELLSAQRYYNIEYSYLERNLASIKEMFERGSKNLEGHSRTNEAGEVKIYRYPAEALEDFTAILAVISSSIQRGESILNQFRNESQSTSANQEIASLRSRYQTSYNELSNIRTQAVTLSDTARSRTVLAVSHRQEGEKLFREAQAAYQRQNYEAARANINRASESFYSSLAIQESASLRGSWDNQTFELARAIAIAENERIIVEVRNLVNTARTLYFSSDFQAAENNLVRARERWLITNSEENDEVLYWLGMVRGGTSARSGRVIPATAPLYPEMSQLLSQAQRNYLEGVRLINTGQRAQGLAKFDEARLQTREVKLMFPVNQEAGILELRMEQFTDPGAFNASFEQRLRTAINGTRQRSLEAYADLLNLAEINPNYSGIRSILAQAEIDMGLRPAPPNPANIARSRDLTASASRILEANLTAQFEVALAQVNEAISLNPNNEDAARVKDRLTSRTSVPGTDVLKFEDEEQYQRAVRELQAGNNLVALALVDRLLQNPQNRNITKLVDLQRRIQSVL